MLLSILWLAVPLLGFGLVISRDIRKKLTDYIAKPIEALAKDPEGWKPGNVVASEVVALDGKFKSYIEERDREKQAAEQLKIDASIGQWASEVAHNIRSPLAALEAASKDLSNLPEDKRLLIRRASERIQDIANKLLKKRKEGRVQLPGTSKELLASLIDNVVSEKRGQFQSKLSLDISSRVAPDSYGLFAKVDPTEINSVLSNLIDNAVDALDGRNGKVEVGLRHAEHGCVEIIVEDNGKGIPEEILPKLMKKDATFGKAHGTGYGLYHAKSYIESLGGSIFLTSTLGVGTSVTLKLPRVAPPCWFVPELMVKRKALVVVVDDDPSIHQIWGSRFEGLNVRDLGTAIIHLSSPTELENWRRDNAKNLKDALFLIDYEFLGSPVSGLDLIESLGIQKRSILVTSRYDEKDLRNRCEGIGVKLIPKSIAGFVPISVEASEFVLIDDDRLVHNFWISSAQDAGKKLSAFYSVDDFLAESTKFPSDTRIYIDSNLGEGRRGEDLAREICSRGFADINLVTGSPDDVQITAVIKSISDKTPPWERGDASPTHSTVPG
jgi:signal transduction histidine kinase